MSTRAERDNRLLTAAELEAVNMTKYPRVTELSRKELLAVGRRLRAARDRARTIGRRQRREMRGKAEPRAATRARDNMGTIAKARVLEDALIRINQALRHFDEAHSVSLTQLELARKALEMKRANRRDPRPSTGRSASKGMQAKPSKKPTVSPNRREIGRVSQAVKSAQAKRDSRRKP